MFTLAAFPTALRIALSGFVLTGCLTEAESGKEPARITVETAIDRMTRDPRMLVITLTSSHRDTLYDTISPRGSRLSLRPAFIRAKAGVPDYVSLEYHVRPDRKWTATARVLDERDSMLAFDSTVLGSLRPQEWRGAALSLRSRFVACPVSFALPNVRGVTLAFTRLQLEVDGRIVRDTFTPVGMFFATGDLFVLEPGYMLPGERRVTFKAYGSVAGEPEPRLLYRGEKVVETASLGKTVEAQEMAVEWVADGHPPDGPPKEGEGVFTVSIGRVPTVTLHANISGAVDI